MIKFIGTDLDGTLLNSNKEISSINVAAIQRAVNLGIVFAACSGRTLNSINKYFKDYLKVPGYQVVLNGGVVVNPKKEILIDHPLDKRIIDEILRRVEFNKFKVVLDGLNKSYIYDTNDDLTTYYEGLGKNHILTPSIEKMIEVNHNTNFKVYKVCLSATGQHLEKLRKKLEMIASLPVTISRSGDNYFEINAQDVTKLSALQKISAVEGIAVADFMCFGDYGNDLDMIKNVGYGVAMDNAIDTVKDAAWSVTKNNDEDGVAYMINKVLDNKK